MSIEPKSFFPYYGAKWQTALKYPAPSYDVIIEPFAGAAGYSTRHYDANVHLYDIDSSIVATWEFLISATSDEVMALPALPDFSHMDELAHLSFGARSLIGYWINPASTVPRNVPTKRALEVGWTARTRERIAEQVSLIDHWTIHNLSYDQIANQSATWFVDPPYNNHAGSLYRHSNIDYQYLGYWSKSRFGQVMVCENEGADWLPFTELHSFNAMAGRQSSEVIYTQEMTLETMLAENEELREWKRVAMEWITWAKKELS